MQLRVTDITTNKEEAFHPGARSSHALGLAGCCVWSWAYLPIGSLQQVPLAETGSLLWPLLLSNPRGKSYRRSCFGMKKVAMSSVIFSSYFTHRLNPENLIYKDTQWQAVSPWLSHRHGSSQPCFWRCWWAPVTTLVLLSWRQSPQDADTQL